MTEETGEIVRTALRQEMLEVVQKQQDVSVFEIVTQLSFRFCRARKRLAESIGYGRDEVVSRKKRPKRHEMHSMDEMGLQLPRHLNG